MQGRTRLSYISYTELSESHSLHCQRWNAPGCPRLVVQRALSSALFSLCEREMEDSWPWWTYSMYLTVYFYVFDGVYRFVMICVFVYGYFRSYSAYLTDLLLDIFACITSWINVNAAYLYISTDSIGGDGGVLNSVGVTNHAIRKWFKMAIVGTKNRRSLEQQRGHLRYQMPIESMN